MITASSKDDSERARRAAAAVLVAARWGDRITSPRPQEASMTMPAEPAAVPRPSEFELATPAMRLQILAAEHASLVQSRTLAWNEAFTRTGMFLSTLSFAMVAVALVAQASGF